VTLVGNPYDLITIADPDLAAVNPFRLAAERLADPDRDMARETLVIAGTTNGYLLLIGRSDPAHKRSGHGEDLLDHACRIAH
jgi:CDP-diacylglycerol pyrophosphatase